MWKLTQFGDSPNDTDLSAIFSRKCDIGAAPVASRLIETAGGWYDPGGTRRGRQSPQTITAEGNIYASDVDAQIQAMTADIGRRAKLYREWSDAATEWCYARLLNVNMPHEWTRRQDTLVPVTLVYQAIGPWNGTVHADSETLSNAYPTLNDFTITNNGNLRQRNVQITVTPQDYDMTYFWIYCGGLGIRFHFDGTIAVGEELVINSETMSITNDGADAYDDLTLESAHTLDGLLALDAGDNDFSVIFNASSGDIKIDFDFYDAWA